MDEAAQLELDREQEVAESKGLCFISLPIPDRGVPHSTQDGLRLVREIADELEAGKNVAVHCRQGIGRSGMIAAGVLVNSGADPEEAIETVSAARGQTVPETPSQFRWVRQLPSQQLVARPCSPLNESQA
jgi:protein-tyrosine phosphatase